LHAEHAPDVDFNAHACDPQNAPPREMASPIREGDLLLLDVFAKQNAPGSV
jgi:Xaa-Pro dipeptidase